MNSHFNAKIGMSMQKVTLKHAVYYISLFSVIFSCILLQEYFIITLDVFKENQYSKEKSTQNAWLSLFTAESVDDLERLVAEYPWMTEICQDMADYLYKSAEVLNMFSEALRILDDNTAQYMVDEMKKEIQEKDELIDAITNKI